MSQDVVEDLRTAIAANKWSIYHVAQSIGVRWHTVRDWLDGRKKPRGLSQKAIRQFLES